MTAPYSESEAKEILKWLKRKKTAQTHNPELIKLAIKQITEVIKTKNFAGNEQNISLGNITLDLSEAAKSTIEYPKNRPRFSKEDYDLKSVSDMNFESLQRTELIGQISPPLRTYLSIGGPRIPVPEGYIEAYTFPKGEIGFGREIKNVTEKGAHIIKGLPINPFAGVPIGWRIEGSSSGTILAPDKDSIFEWGVDFEKKDEEKHYTVSPGLDEIVQKEIKNCERFIPSPKEQAYWREILPLPKIFKDAIEKAPEEMPDIIAAWMRTRKYFCHNELGKMIKENADDLPILVRELKGGHCDLLSWETTALLRSYGIPAWTQTVRVPSLDGTKFENAYLHSISTYVKDGELKFIDASALAKQDEAFHPKNLKTKEVQQFHEQYVQFIEDPEKRKALKEFREQREKKPNKHKGGYGLFSLGALLGSINTSKDQEKRETKAVVITGQREDELWEYVNIQAQLEDSVHITPISVCLEKKVKRTDRAAFEKALEISRKYQLDSEFSPSIENILTDFEHKGAHHCPFSRTWRFYFKNKTLVEIVELLRSNNGFDWGRTVIKWPTLPLKFITNKSHFRTEDFLGLLNGRDYGYSFLHEGQEVDIASGVLFADQMKQSWRQKHPTKPLNDLNIDLEYLTEQSNQVIGPFLQKRRSEKLAKHAPIRPNPWDNTFHVFTYKPSDVCKFRQSFRRALQRLDVKRLDRGMELDWGGFRPYVIGDDSKLIDQNIYARTEEFVVKTYKSQQCISSPLYVIFGKNNDYVEHKEFYFPKLFFILKELEAEMRKTGREIYVTAHNEPHYYKLTPRMDIFRFWSGISDRNPPNRRFMSPQAKNSAEEILKSRATSPRMAERMTNIRNDIEENKKKKQIPTYLTQRGTLPKNVIYISDSDFSCAAASYHFRNSRIETICTLADEYELHPLANPNWVQNGLPEERIFKKEE